MLQFIANYKSGRGTTAKYCRKLTSWCIRHGIEYRLHPTKYAGHCRDLVGELERSGEHDIVILGGDGTFHEALNGVTDFTRTRLGFIPCGSGNDFVSADRSTFRKRRPIAALRGILAGNTRTIDYMQFDCGLRCLNCAGTGLDIEVLLKSRAYRRLHGSPAYLKSLLRVLRSFDPYPIRVTANGRTAEYNALLACACNGSQFGGGMHVSPRSHIDDGKIQLVVIKDIPRKRIKWLLPRLITGTHLNLSCCVTEPADEVRIECTRECRIELDGEIYSAPFSCRIVPRGLTVFC